MIHGGVEYEMWSHWQVSLSQLVGCAHKLRVQKN